ncbi:hypothetical protein CAEBREN_04145 [Caenorhabditis brenneri]|uniref:Ubiquitin-like protease family profile domain-containing protein n=1 Tax=Caenorhabditis brenneri TaxID=135651 RepID=G0P7Z0_CAEBE|nr:hypothetical protein CAEBREN_04145 [Caenorhabditis brenneri]
MPPPVTAVATCDFTAGGYRGGKLLPFTATIFSDISEQIIHLFGHVYPEEIPVAADDEYEAQTDNFSCGYRVIGALVDIARRRNPSMYIYSRSAILTFLRNILNEPKPTWEMFKNAKLGFEKEYSGDCWRVELLRNSPNVTPSTPPFDDSPNDPQDSKEFIGSEKFAQKLNIRARAGHENHHEEHHQESHLDRMMRCFHTWDREKTVEPSSEASIYGYIISTFQYFLNISHKA